MKETFSQYIYVHHLDIQGYLSIKIIFTYCYLNIIWNDKLVYNIQNLFLHWWSNSKHNDEVFPRVQWVVTCAWHIPRRYLGRNRIKGSTTMQKWHNIFQLLFSFLTYRNNKEPSPIEYIIVLWYKNITFTTSLVLRWFKHWTVFIKINIGRGGDEEIQAWSFDPTREKKGLD